MFEPDTVSLLESGSALIVGAATPDGAPLAARGWGLTVLDAGASTRVRLLLSTQDPAVLDALGPDAAVAVTAADVGTLRAVQIKGRVVEVTETTDDDRARSARYRDALFADIVVADGAQLSMLERWIPADVAVCVIEVDECFDQTPGPGAGSPLPAVSS